MTCFWDNAEESVEKLTLFMQGFLEHYLKHWSSQSKRNATTVLSVKNWTRNRHSDSHCWGCPKPVPTGLSGYSKPTWNLGGGDGGSAKFPQTSTKGEGDAGYFHVELVFLFSARVFYSVFPEEVFFRQKWFCDYKCVVFEKPIVNSTGNTPSLLSEGK